VRIGRIAAALLLAAALAGCRPAADASLAEIPAGASFVSAGEEAGFAAGAELLLYPDHEVEGGGLAQFMVNVTSLSGRHLRDVRTVVFYPQVLVEEGWLPEPYLVHSRGFDVTPGQPSYGVGVTFRFPDWEQADLLMRVAEEPVRLRLVWKGGERLLEIPPGGVTVTRQEEFLRLPHDPDSFMYPTHPALVDHLVYSEGRYLSRAAGVSAAELLDWYRAALPPEGWEPLPAHDGALLFRKEDRFLSLSASDGGGGMAELWSHERDSAELSKEAAIRIVMARYPVCREGDGPGDGWTAEYRGASPGPERPLPRGR